MTQKQFALKQLSPYFINPKLCGIDEKTKFCRFSFKGKMCVVGKNLLPDVLKDNNQVGISVHMLLEKYKRNQYNIFIPESCDVLTDSQWTYLQMIHDKIALFGPNSSTVHETISNLGLFTVNELTSYSKNF